MLIKAIKHVVFFFLMSLVQIALIPNLPGHLKSLNAILVVLIFIAVVYEFYLSAVYGVLFGVLLDLYSSLPFGAILLSLMITLYVIYKVFKRVLTNKSFYTLVGLTLLGTTIYSLILYFYLYLVLFFQTKDMNLIHSLSVIALNNFLWHFLLNIIFVVVLFFVFHAGSRRFKAVFIDTTKN